MSVLGLLYFCVQSASPRHDLRVAALERTLDLRVLRARQACASLCDSVCGAPSEGEKIGAGIAVDVLQVT